MLLAACSSDDEGNENQGAKTPVAAGPLSGTVAGQPWSVTAVEAESFPGETTFDATAYSEAVTACQTVGLGNKPSLLFSLPNAPGDYPLGLESELSVTFFIPEGNENLFSFDGHIVIDSVTATQISGGLVANFDAANSVNGKFTATICP